MPAPIPNPAWKQDIRAGLRGTLLDRPEDLAQYTTDASLYALVPQAVLLPADAEDIARAVDVCARHGVPVTPRGGGTSLTGQSIGLGLVIDVSPTLRRVREVNPEERWVRVEPGITRDELNAVLLPHGLHFAPDPASGYAATVGGMIGTNSSGMRSIRHGMTVDHVLEVTAVLSNGSIARFGDQDPPDGIGLAARATQRLRALVTEHTDLIRERTPRVVRRSGGYALDALLPERGFNPARVFCGAEGTLGLVVEAKLRLTPLPAVSRLCLVHFHEVWDALSAAAPLAACGITAAELVDGLILREARRHPLTAGMVAMLEGDPGAILLVETQADTVAQADAAMARVQAALTSCHGVLSAPVFTDPARQRAAWAMRSAALGLISHAPGREKPQPYIEDAAVPLDRLHDYIRETRDICRAHGREIALFAHASVGLLHIRPLHDLHLPGETDRMARIQREVLARVKAHGGSWSGEHGDGLARGAHLPEVFGEKLCEVFRDVKQAFDPAGLFNPGRKVAVAPPFEPGRFRHEHPPRPVSHRFRHARHGTLEAEVEACNGVGNCRQLTAGVMCPSFRATRREADTVRGRANLLRTVLSGGLGSPVSLNRPELREVLDLCVSCRACARECPNRIDMARLKAEVQHAGHLAHGVPLHDQWLGDPARLHGWTSRRKRAWANAWMQSRAGRAVLSRLLGVSDARPLPRLAEVCFSDLWQREQTGITRSGAPPVAFLVDVWSEHFEPGIALALARILHRLGFDPRPILHTDSQRAAISRGLLDLAAERGLTLYRQLETLVAAGTPVLVIEPSCFSALTEDLPDLVADAALARRVAAGLVFADRFVADRLAGTGLAHGFGKVLFHAHCHQRAQDLTSATADLLRAAGFTPRDTQAGCCGLAGAWGYEHEELSRRIAEDRFLPALRNRTANESFCATGFSCRCQARELAQVQARHPLELVADVM